MIAWLIEIGDSVTYYWCGPGDWCSNPNHAFKFETEMAAVECKYGLGKMVGGPAHVVEHMWI